MNTFFADLLATGQGWVFHFFQVATTHTMVNLATIILLGILGQWLAWMVNLPSILLLLVFGFLAGPVTGLILPDQLFGELLTPLVSLSVGIILFEGGLNLKVSDLSKIGRVVRGLLSIGVLATWVQATVLAHLLLPLSFPLCLLFGAILTVTGPTVIIPLLRQIKPDPRIASILRWEGILVDPVGATLAVLVFQVILLGTFRSVPEMIFGELVRVIFWGFVSGGLGAGSLYLLFRHHLVPEFLHNPLTLGMVLGVFAFSNQVQEESGLLAVTLAGIFLGAQRTVPVRHILAFKENLQTLLISSLFILLAARLSWEDLEDMDWRLGAFILGLIFVVRPASVWLSTVGTDLTTKEKLYLSMLAPRGIVAASVASIFAMKLTYAGNYSAYLLVPYTFAVIVGTVLFYGLLAGYLSRFLGISQANPQGTIILGAHEWGRALGKRLVEWQIPVLFADQEPWTLRRAADEKLPTLDQSIFSEDLAEYFELHAYRRILCLSASDEVNCLASIRCREFFDGHEIFQLPPRAASFIPNFLRGRFLFSESLGYSEIESRFSRGWRLDVLTMGELRELLQARPELSTADTGLVLLFHLGDRGDLHVLGPDAPPRFRSGRILVLRPG